MAKHIYTSVAKITRGALERYGFAYAEILNHWPVIAGPVLAACSAPERIRWPRPAKAEAVRDARRRSGGTLVVRVADGRAVELQHETPRIIERVNTYYGYHAISEIKLVQGLLPGRGAKRRRPAELPPESRRALDEELRTIEDVELRAALTRLGRGALAHIHRKGD